MLTCQLRLRRISDRGHSLSSRWRSQIQRLYQRAHHSFL